MSDERPLLPDQTSDELAEWSDERATESDDERLTRERPPHYDR